ncbi:GDSL lipase/esterase [Mycotypha africana]|uniref:GDSL lipase/esterase n=1 Tax=Mycotypha africana TaxID=64632 RepID=UPI002300E274|nr:GDSL lipase/esterase [Mycotypha africana]KAI8991452.1 GDSL lipase/esterase [Mycotypha africana]
MRYRWSGSTILCYILSVLSLQAGIIQCRSTFRERRGVGFSRIFAFGDSYTDNGSFDGFFESNSNEIDTASLHPQTSNYIRRSADGPLWIEHLAEILGDVELFDFARSGSTANNDITPRGTEDMNTQVNSYLSTSVASASKSGSAYFLWTGVNDINDLFKKYDGNIAQCIKQLDDIVSTIEDAWRKLQKSGANYIVFLGLIPLQELPMYQEVQSNVRNNLKELILEYNDRLRLAMDKFRSGSPNVQAFFFDTYGLFEQNFSPEEREKNARQHCNAGESCDGYIWWDKLHPSSKTHRRIAEAVFQSMQNEGWL